MVTNELLSRVLASHGGLDNWSRVVSLTARMSLGGPFWKGRGWPDVYASTTVEVDSRREHISFTPFTAPDRRSSFDAGPERIAIETLGGETVEERTDPRSSFPPFELTTRWDALQVAYFTSYAVWNYLTAPYLLTYPGVQVREIEPWNEDCETWSRLQVDFPESIATHNREQVFYFGSDDMLRRLDYKPEVTGASISQYVSEPRVFDGFVFPTRRHVYLRGADNTADKRLAVITLSVEDVSVRRQA